MTQLRTPFSMLVVGPSGSGKSQFVNKLIQSRNDLFSPTHKDVVWCYGIWQDFYKSLPYKMHKGAPTTEILSRGDFILVVDDQMDEAQELMSQIFTKISHHNNISCIFLTQNLFPNGRYSRNISLNANYLVLMKNVRDKAQISYLARQVYPGNSKFLIDVFNDATVRPFTYLFMDFKPDTEDAYRILTGILPTEKGYRYIPA